jgi:hypothetical protein
MTTVINFYAIASITLLASIVLLRALLCHQLNNQLCIVSERLNTHAETQTIVRLQQISELQYYKCTKHTKIFQRNKILLVTSLYLL